MNKGFRVTNFCDQAYVTVDNLICTNIRDERDCKWYKGYCEYLAIFLHSNKIWFTVIW